MSDVFLDSVGLIALWDKSDQWHAAAEAAYQNLKSQRRNFVMTRYVMLECGNAAQRRPYRGHVIRTMRRLVRDNALIDPTDQGWDDA